MPNFKAGDKVELVSGALFSNKQKVVTIKKVTDNGYGAVRAHLLETNTHVYESEIKLHTPAIKVGDKVEKTSGTTFSNGKLVVTVEEVKPSAYGEGLNVWFKETGTHLAIDDVVLHEPAKVEPVKELEIKAGNLIERKDGTTFSNGKYIVTVDYVDNSPVTTGRKRIWIKETRTHTNKDYVRLATVKQADAHAVGPATDATVRAPVTDNVNSPAHYTKGGIETLDFMRAKLTAEGYVGYLQGNIIKYTVRFEHKNGVEDLKKAQFYLRELIEVKEGK